MIINRKNTKKVMVGNVQIGNNDHVIIQSMTSTKTSNTKKTLREINNLVKNGCELVRIAVLDEKDCQAIKQIVTQSPCPIVADIHYNYRFAIDAIESGVAKIRINPANIKDIKQLREIVECAKKYKKAIRLGFNKGSYNKISNDVLIKQVLHYVKLFEKWKFYNIIISIKTSSVKETIDLNTKVAQLIKYPIHLGLSEAGTYVDAIIKSSISLAKLLENGIGNTIRISISGSPLYEPIVAKKILGTIGLLDNQPNIISCPTCGRLQWGKQSFVEKIDPIINSLNKKITITIMGCAVNGIGEAKNADLGIYGNKTHCFIYKNHKLIKKVLHRDALAEFKKILLQ